jgi:hypothetical protein
VSTPLYCVFAGNPPACTQCLVPAENATLVRRCWGDPMPGFIAAPTKPPCRAGTHLRILLSKFGINADEPGCHCVSHAAKMNSHGCDWCDSNLDTIVGWLREEAGKRGLPFLDAAGRLLVRRAIANARREQARAEEAKDS